MRYLSRLGDVSRKQGDYTLIEEMENRYVSHNERSVYSIFALINRRNIRQKSRFREKPVFFWIQSSFFG